MELKVILLSLIIFGFFTIIPSAYSEILTQTMEGSMDLEITYPESIMIGRTFSISIHLQNNGWENKQDISFDISNPDRVFAPLGDEKIRIDELTPTSSFGTTLDYDVSNGANVGTHFLNISYSQILVSNNVDPMPVTKSNIALPILIEKEPIVRIETTTPESIFSNTEFPFEVTVTSDDIDLSDLSVQIMIPQDIEIRGDTSYNISLLEKAEPYTINAELMTPLTDITTEYTIPVKVTVSYTDDLGNEKSESQSVPLLLRPKTFMEITNNGGIWIGDFFIAPYVSIGTIVGIPAGTILSLLIRRAQNKKKRD